MIPSLQISYNVNSCSFAGSPHVSSPGDRMVGSARAHSTAVVRQTVPVSGMADCPRTTQATADAPTGVARESG